MGGGSDPLSKVSTLTNFLVHQSGGRISGRYHGGDLRAGRLDGYVDEAGNLLYRYAQVTTDGSLQRGVAVATPDVAGDSTPGFSTMWMRLDGDCPRGASSFRSAPTHLRPPPTSFHFEEAVELQLSSAFGRMAAIPVELLSLSPAAAAIGRAAWLSGEAVRAIAGENLTIREKSLRDYATQADDASEYIGLTYLRLVRPEAGNLAEESTKSYTRPSGPANIVDPLDATTAYIKGMGSTYSSILMAATNGEVTEAGVAYFPFSGEFFFASKGGGAYKSGQDGSCKRLQCAEKDIHLASSWIDFNRYGDSKYDSPLVARLYDACRGAAGVVTSHIPHSGIACRIAAGENGPVAVIHDNNPAKGKQEPWDVIPVAILVLEAGGVVLNLRGEPYDPYSLEPFIIAASPELGRQIVENARALAV